MIVSVRIVLVIPEINRIALSRDEKAKTSWMESKLKGNRERLTIKERVAEPHEYVPTEIQVELWF